MNFQVHRPWHGLSVIVLGVLLLGGCVAPLASPSPSVSSQPAGVTHAETASEAATLPALTPAALEGRKLRVVATTNLVGDAVARVGGDHIELTTLLAPGVDPHAYQLAPADRQQLEDADVILVNGLGLEEGMLPVLAELAERVPVVAVSAGIAILEFGEHEEDEHADEEDADEAHEHEEDADDGHADDEHADEEHEHEAHGDEAAHHHHEGADPHTWQSVPNVIVWTENIAATLSALDPAHADDYAVAATSYQADLGALNADLHALVDTLPTAQRKLVTDHDSLGYLAHEYGFNVIGTVIPSLSTVAAASAQELAALQEQITAEGVSAIFVGTTVNAQLTTQLAADLGIQVVPIYTDSLSDADGPAATYVDFMRHNLQTIVDALHD